VTCSFYDLFSVQDLPQTQST